ncbi:sulfite exporter TauE/SafE family protein [Candidatus Woesearchaeota archaeon]|nr:sulfite exporter TauE/SafE family protein [Candidatus Woesearchaeota archaeon]
MIKERNWGIFVSSIFFVLGFSLVFSLLGVLLQSVLSGVSYGLQKWLGRIGGTIIILFGLYLLGLIRPKFLEKEYTLKVKRRFKYSFLTSFVFGAAFAVGWTPCVGAILGAILTLAATQPTNAFLLMLSYSIGLGVPFMLVGLFANEAQRFISWSSKWVAYANYVLGSILIMLGILVFTNQLSRIASLSIASDLLIKFNLAGITFGSSLNLAVAFLAGIASFLSPCVLPLIPAFLSYLTSTAVGKTNEKS